MFFRLSGGTGTDLSRLQWPRNSISRRVKKLSWEDESQVQNRYKRGCLSPVSDMNFQFWAIWAAQGSKGKINYELLASFGVDIFNVLMGKKNLNFFQNIVASALKRGLTLFF